jgi:hypothetical protein
MSTNKNTNVFGILAKKVETHVVHWRIILNTFAVLCCASGVIVYYIIKESIDSDLFTEEDFFLIRPYLYIPAGLLMLIMLIFLICLSFDISLFFKIPLLDDLRDRYVMELAEMLEYTIVRREDPLRAELEQYKRRHLEPLDEYEEHFQYSEQIGTQHNNVNEER